MTDGIRHLLRFVVGLPVSIGAAVSLFVLFYHMEGSGRMPFALALLAVGIGGLIWYILRQRKRNQQVEKLLDILYKDIDPEKFIKASEDALEKTKSRAFQDTLRFNLAVGYEAAGAFDKAIAVMKEIDIRAADKVTRAMFYCNLATFYAQKGALSEGQMAYTTGQPFFEKAGKALPMGYVRFSRGLLHFAEEQYEEAIEVFAGAKNRGFEDRHTMTKLQLFEARAHVKLGNIKEARQIYGKILQKNTYPYLIQTAKAEFKKLDKTIEK